MFFNDLEHHSTVYDGRACLIHWENGEYKVLSFGQLTEISDRLAAAVISRLKGDSNVVLIILKHHFLQLPLFVGCMKAGLIPSFLPFPTPKLDSELYWKSHQEVIRRIRPGLIITYSDNLARISSILDSSLALVVDISDLADYPGTHSWHAPDLDSVALLQHSSGTTGLKKGVMLTYRQIEL